MKKVNQAIAIVTGGGSGIGLAIAKKFSENNIYTIVIGRDKTKLAAAEKMLGTNGKVIQLDLTKLEDIPALVKSIHDEYGHIDILVNNAGINQKKEFTQVTDDEFQNILYTNVNSVFSISREVVKVMEEQK